MGSCGGYGLPLLARHGPPASGLSSAHAVVFGDLSDPCCATALLIFRLRRVLCELHEAVVGQGSGRIRLIGCVRRSQKP